MFDTYGSDERHLSHPFSYGLTAGTEEGDVIYCLTGNSLLYERVSVILVVLVTKESLGCRLTSLFITAIFLPPIPLQIPYTKIQYFPHVCTTMAKTLRIWLSVLNSERILPDCADYVLLTAQQPGETHWCDPPSLPAIYRQSHSTTC